MTQLQPLCIVPEQFFPTLEPEPERRLMVAVLEDAIRVYRRTAGRADRASRRLFAETAAWLHGYDDSWPFSCVAVCRALGIDVRHMRRGLGPQARFPSRFPVATRPAHLQATSGG